MLKILFASVLTIRNKTAIAVDIAVKMNIEVILLVQI
jgi:hypothetical protein